MPPNNDPNINPDTDEIKTQKIVSIHKCIQRAREEYKKAGEHFDEDFSRQDASIMNILRACEQAIDLANHIIKQEKIGVPTTSKESFDLLCHRKKIPTELAKKMKKNGRLLQHRRPPIQCNRNTNHRFHH